MKSATTTIIFVAASLAGCGGVYQISRDASHSGTRADFQRDELFCNQRNFFVLSEPTDMTQTIYLTERFKSCMQERGWRYSLQERKLSLAKPAGL